MKANRFTKNDEGVSAVIGVILMVAITVILAAVIAAFVFGMVGSTNQKKSPAFTVKRIANGTAVVTFVDFGGAQTITALQTATGSDGNLGSTNPVIGGTYNTGAIPATGAHIVLKATVDGNEQVVLDATI